MMPLPQIQNLDLPGIDAAIARTRGMQTQNRLGAMALQRQEAVGEFGPAAATGDEGAMKSLAGIAPDEARKLQQTIAGMKQSEREEARLEIEDLAKAAQWADTPGKWNQAIDFMTAEGNEDAEQYRDQFTSRELIINRARDLAGMFGSSKAPTVQNFYDDETGQSYKAEWNPQTQKWDRVGGTKAPTGTRVTTGADGTTTIEVGNLGKKPDSVTKATRNKLEGKQLQVTDQLARIKDIEGSFDPKFLQLGTRWSNMVAGIKDKAGFELDAADKQTLKDYTVFRRRSIDNINKLLNELSGAAVSPQEAERIRKSMPDAGDGVFDGDGPTAFEAKLDDLMRQLKMSLFRYSYARKSGLDPVSIPLSGLPDLIEEEGAKIEGEVRKANPDASDDVVDLEVRARLGALFGGQF